MISQRISQTIRAALSRAVWPDAMPAARRVVVHEWFTTMGGSDKVAAQLGNACDADVLYVYALNDDLVDRLGVNVPVVTWRFGRSAARFGRLVFQLPLIPLVWRCLDVAAADIVVTSSHCATNSVHTGNARLVSYVHTPMRYAWDWRLERARVPAVLRWVLPLAAPVLRAGDRRRSRNVDTFVSNSSFVRERIERYYGRDADVVPPPIDLDFWTRDDAPRSDKGEQDLKSRPFVVAGRFVAYKETHVAVEAATMIGADLVVAGSGPELERLLVMAGPTVRFVDRPDDEGLRAILRSAQALLFPGVEDFGMLPLEAQAVGTPVIARAAGGAMETVIEGRTGAFVDSNDPKDWAAAMDTFEPDQFDAEQLRANAASYGPARFEQRIREAL